MTTDTASLADFLDLTYRPDLGVIAARWLRPTTSGELRAGYQLLLHHADTCDACQCWLIDSRRRVKVDSSDVHWLTEQFYPTLRRHLGRHVFLAFLVAPYQLEDVQDDTLPALPQTHGDYCSVQQFTDEGEAVRWLCSRR